MVLISNNDDVIYTNANSDPYSIGKGIVKNDVIDINSLDGAIYQILFLRKVE